jgi:hypothetical protein
MCGFCLETTLWDKRAGVEPQYPMKPEYIREEGNCSSHPTTRGT